MAKKEKPFNNPFGTVTLNPPVFGQAAPAAQKVQRPKASPPVEADSEAAMFLASVGAVEPVRRGASRVLTAKAAVLPAVPSEDDDVLAQLSELVSGDAPFERSDTETLIEGSVANLDRKILKRLKAGDYALQGTLDLHGLTQLAARAQLEKFIGQARQAQRRCVLVIHGKGLHSEALGPVLKQGVPDWLSHGRLGRQVLAFSSALPKDGGDGALYVLLRR